MVRRTDLGVAALAAATLLLESTLTRLLAVAQFYHFAFLVVSLALLGFGASGSLLGLVPRLARPASLERVLAGAGTGFAVSALLAYAVVNWLPFDSYSIAWDRRQILYFVLYYLALTLPFLSAGLGIGAGLAAAGQTSVSEGSRSHLVYAANLLGSAAGTLLAPAALGIAGVPGAVLASVLIGLVPPLLSRRQADGLGRRGRRLLRWGAVAVWLAGLLLLGGLGVANAQDRGALGMTLSPYKGLSHALRYPGATLIFSRWSPISRADVVANAGTRQLPGLSYVYEGAPPPQHGLSLDGDSLQPITLIEPEAFAAAAFLPEALAFQVRPSARALVLEPGGGLSVLQALAGGAQEVTAVVGDPLVRRAVARTNPGADPYSHPGVRTVLAPGRVFLASDPSNYDVVLVPLTDAYRPVASGAYSLSESYGLTVEAFEAALAHLAPGGLLVVTRWLQIPPSEDLRLLATLIEALERRGMTHSASCLVAYRGIQTLTALVQPDGWQPGELAQVRVFAESRRYDLVWAPDVRPDEVNRFNRLPRPELFEVVRRLLESADRRRDYQAYAFAVAPATDDRPFFFHFFRWGQTPQVLATLGRTWQPFGGSGYLILVAMLALVLVLSAILIVVPLALSRKGTGPLGRPGTGAPGAEEDSDGGGRVRLQALAYFGLLGIAFLFVEIPSIQRGLLLLGQPTYAFTVVVLTLLLFSSLGSVLARSVWLPRRTALGFLVALAALLALGGQRWVAAALGWPTAARVGAVVVSLAPLAVLMGLPFPLGLAWLEARAPKLIPWAWAVNGCASVIASVLAAILALTYGFTVVLLLGTAAYGLAATLMARALTRRGGGLPL